MRSAWTARLPKQRSPLHPPVFNATSVVITPADSNTVTAGHQVSLSAGKNAVAITVTAEDGATTKTYTVNINRGVTDPVG